MGTQLTLLLAVWGSLLSTLTFVWILYLQYKDKTRVQVSCFVGGLISGNMASEEDYVVFRITNNGKRPIVITGLGGSYQDHDFRIPVPTLPRTLQPGQSMAQHTADVSMVGQPSLKNLWALDSAGNSWKVNKENLTAIKRYI